MSLPSLENPPLHETVLGVQFDPVQSFSNAHLGLFWNELNDGWTHVEDQKPIEPSFERFEGKSSFHPQQFQVKLSDDPSSRLQITNEERTRMIQVQNGRFHYNWMKGPGGKYPRYEQIKEEFNKKLNFFQQFLDDHDLEKYEPNQWEVTYVNHFLKGNFWEETNDISSIFTILSDREPITKQILEGINFSLRYEIEPEIGRVHVNIQNGSKEFDGDDKEIIVLKLTARGAVEGKSGDGLSLFDGLDKGRERIVDSFFSLTTQEAQEYWDRS